jgi:hypothetical protein
MNNTTPNNSSSNYILTTLKGYEGQCFSIKTTDGKMMGFVMKCTYGEKYSAIYHPRGHGRVIPRSMLGIAERTSIEECAEIVTKTYINRYSRFITI